MRELAENSDLTEPGRAAVMDAQRRIDAARMYTVEEAANLTSLGRTTLYAEIGAGRLMSVRVGRARRIRAADLAAYVDQLSDAGAV